MGGAAHDGYDRYFSRRDRRGRLPGAQHEQLGPVRGHVDDLRGRKRGRYLCHLASAGSDLGEKETFPRAGVSLK